MPDADAFDAPQGGTFHGRLLEAITEAFAGNGIANDGDADVTADSGTAMGIDVSAATDLRYSGSDYDPPAAAFTLSTGPTSTTNGQDDRRADLVFFDSDAGAYDVTEGTAHPNPEPPSTPADALMLAVVDVGHDASDISDDDIINWRAHPAASYPVGTSGIEEGAVTAAKVSTDAVDTGAIVAGAVGTGELADDAVTAAKVAADAVDSSAIVAGAVGTGGLSDDAVTAAKVAADAIGNEQMADDAIDTAEIADDAVVAAAIATGAVDSAELADGAVGSTQLAGSSVGTSELADGAVTDDQVGGSADISRSKVDTDRITTSVSAATTTDGEDVIFADTSGGTFPVTLASADAVDGREIRVVDVGGSAGSESIDVDTEGSETIDGSSPPVTISENYGGAAFISDGSNWFTAP